MSKKVGGWKIALLACLVAAPAALLWAEDEGEKSEEEVELETCMACHGDPEGDDYVHLERFKQSAHGIFPCTACHGDVDIEDLPHEEKLEKVDCTLCHPDIGEEYSGGVHGVSKDKGVEDAPGCADCHGAPHDILPKDNPRSPVHPLKQPGLCAGCHADERITTMHTLAPPDFIRKYFESDHGSGDPEGGVAFPAVCSDCHGAHDVRPHTDERSMVHHSNIPATCKACHADVFDDFESSAHGKLWKAGEEQGPVCTTCHRSHEIKNTDTATFRFGMANECGECHEDVASTYQDSFHGKATSLGYLRAAKCSDCHTSHLNLPKDDPASTIAPANLVETCGACHEGINERFAGYNPHADPKDKDASPVLYYTYLFFVALLGAVFTFFGVHTLLWLQRSVVAVARREVTRTWCEDRYVVRFERLHRIVHVIIVISFLGLAATGLPLKYHYTEWAQTLVGAIGGVEAARLIHRVFAIVTIGYFLFHLAYLVYRGAVKRAGPLLHGPFSMVPRKKDLVDLGQNLRWFLYRGPRPKLDRWTYWEKFDYFAVFWGVPVIGFSGLMLWFPEFFTRFMPGSALNVATVVHGEEALLAIGFIFIFHFFHNHLRMENFPLDTVIFTGRMPLDRFKDERPEEYERMVRDGTLEKHLVDPPSPLIRAFSACFGYAALMIGILLVVAIAINFVSGP